MLERGRFQRAIDLAVEYSREHPGLTTGSGLFAGGAAIEASPVPGKEIVGIPMLLIGGIIGMVSSLIEYYDRIIEPHTRKASPTNETTIMDTSEIQSLLAISTEKSPPAS